MCLPRMELHPCHPWQGCYHSLNRRSVSCRAEEFWARIFKIGDYGIMGDLITITQPPVDDYVRMRMNSRQIHNPTRKRYRYDYRATTKLTLRSRR